MTVAVLADQIVAQRLALERRMRRVTPSKRGHWPTSTAPRETPLTPSPRPRCPKSHRGQTDIRADVNSLSGGASDC